MRRKKNFIVISLFSLGMMKKIQNKYLFFLGHHTIPPWRIFLHTVIFFGKVRYKIIEGVIASMKIYQKTFSPDHGLFCEIIRARRCRFYPSCSEYAIQSLRQYGLVFGIMLSLKRITRCNPFAIGGYDPVRKKVTM